MNNNGEHSLQIQERLREALNVKHSISSRLLTYVFAIYLLIAIIVTIAHVVIEYLDTQSIVLLELKQIHNTLAPSFAQRLWDLNDIELQSSAVGAVNLPLVAGIQINDESNVVKVRLGKTDDDSEKHASGNEKGLSLSSQQRISYSAPIHYVSKYESHMVGSATLFADQDAVFNRVKLGFYLIIVNAVIKTCALWIIFLFISRVLLSRPLTKLTNAVEQLDLQSLSDTPLNIGVKGQNELTRLQNKFNLMVGKIRAQKDELIETNQALEARVKERTIALENSLIDIEKQHDILKKTQAQLVHSEKLASLGTLTAGIAHEINNPVNFSQVSAQNLRVDLQKFEDYLHHLLEDEEADSFKAEFKKRLDPLYKQIDIILNGTERISHLVGDLKTFSRMETKEFKSTDLNEAILSTLNIVVQPYKNSIHFETELCEELSVTCRPAEINQVLMNLIVNACQAIHSQPDDTSRMGNIKVTSQIVGEEAEIIVLDDGCGMDRRTQSRIFDPFFTTKDVGEGTGLGLSISYSIIEDHNGSLEVQSEPGKGTEFTIRLPLTNRDSAQLNGTSRVHR